VLKTAAEYLRDPSFSQFCTGKSSREGREENKLSFVAYPCIGRASFSSKRNNLIVVGINHASRIGSDNHITFHVPNLLEICSALGYAIGVCENHSAL
jgi:hypothetical protein